MIAYGNSEIKFDQILKHKQTEGVLSTTKFSMPTHITQSLDSTSGKTLFKVKGEILTDDALLLERIVRDNLSEEPGTVELDLADIDFLDSDSAPILRRIADNQRVMITGVEIFLQTAVDSVERSSYDQG